MITNLKLAEANIAYIRSKKLAALTGKKEPQYIYKDGCRCAIGTVLESVGPGQQNLPLVQLLLFRDLDFQDIGLAGQLQVYHDRWLLWKCKETSVFKDLEDTYGLDIPTEITGKQLYAGALTDLYGKELPEDVSTILSDH